MADLSKIKVGDKLRLEVTVTGIDDSEMPIDVIVGDDEDFWPHTWVEAAEHIPAPRKYFKRGDWVKWDHGKTDCVHRYCLFIKEVLTEPALVEIDDDGQKFTVAVDQLEPDEAPE